MEQPLVWTHVGMVEPRHVTVDLLSVPPFARVRIGDGLVWQDHPTEIRQVLAEVDRQLTRRPSRSQLADIDSRYDRYCAGGMKRPAALRLATNRVLGVA